MVNNMKRNAPHITLPPKEGFVTDKTFKLYREYIRHQYGLINHRTSWYIGLQSILFAAFGFTIQYKAYSVASAFQTKLSMKAACGPKSITCQSLGYLDWMMIVYGVIGLCVSVVFYKLIIAASGPITDIIYRWDKIKANLVPADLQDITPNITGGFTPEYADKGRILTKYLPLIVMVVWIIILCVTQLFPILKNASFLRYTLPWHVDV